MENDCRQTGGSRRKIWLAIGIPVAVLLVIAAWVGWGYLGGSGLSEARWVYLPANVSREEMRDSLVSALGDDTGAKVDRLWSVFGEDQLPHGAFRVEAGTSAARIYRRLSRGAQTPVRVTFNNVRTMRQLASRVASRMEFDDSGFLAACDSVLLAKGLKTPHYPAAFFPDTYEFYWTDSPVKVVKRLSAEYDRFWDDARRGRAAALGLTPVEVATVASIVEEETNNRAERGTVARLYLNRLKEGMKLQADPTVKFAVGDFSLRRILGKHLATLSPYNTYIYKGLPPGPIRIVDRATLDAVLGAPANDYLYMCAKEDFSGAHNFTRSYSEHLANARRYQAALNAKNIK